MGKSFRWVSWFLSLRGVNLPFRIRVNFLFCFLIDRTLFSKTYVCMYVSHWLGRTGCCSWLLPLPLRLPMPVLPVAVALLLLLLPLPMLASRWFLVSSLGRDHITVRVSQDYKVRVAGWIICRSIINSIIKILWGIKRIMKIILRATSFASTFTLNFPTLSLSLSLLPRRPLHPLNPLHLPYFLSLTFVLSFFLSFLFFLLRFLRFFLFFFVFCFVLLCSFELRS